MAPLTGAVPARAPNASLPGAAGTPQAGEGGPFSFALDQAANAASAGGKPAPGPDLAPEAGLEEVPEVPDDLSALPSAEATALAAAQGAVQVAAVPPPEAPWPPAGLAGLFGSGSGAGGETPVTPAGADQAASPALRPRGPAPGPFLAIQPGTAAAAAATPVAASAAGGASGAPADASTAAAIALAAADGPTSASGGDASAALEGAEPAPPAFGLPPLPAPAATREAAPPLAAPGPAPDVRAQDFGERFGAQLQWMAEQNIGHARIRVSPQELGPVEVLLHLDGDRISADFISGHAETRQALEQGLPRLRDLLGEHGFQLAHAGVGGDASPSPGQAGTSGGTMAADGDEAAMEPSRAREPAPKVVSRGLLDAYA